MLESWIQSTVDHLWCKGDCQTLTGMSGTRDAQKRNGDFEDSTKYMLQELKQDEDIDSDDRLKERERRDFKYSTKTKDTSS